MNRSEIVAIIKKIGAIAVIRMNESKKIIKVIEAIHKGGISGIEITLTTPNAAKVIEELNKTMEEEILIGAGSVLSFSAAAEAITAGAKFIVSPILKSGIISEVHKYDLPVIPGCFSPTEIQEAYEEGADIIKVFPADVLGMPFFKAIKAPMPYLNLMPTGGVTLTNAGEWIKSGACAVGVGGALLDRRAIDEENYSQLTENARTLISSINSVKN